MLQSFMDKEIKRIVMNFTKDKLSCCEKIFSRLLYPYCNQQPGGHLEERNQCLRTWAGENKNYLVGGGGKD